MSEQRRKGDEVLLDLAQTVGRMEGKLDSFASESSSARKEIKESITGLSDRVGNLETSRTRFKAGFGTLIGIFGIDKLKHLAGF